MSTLNVSNITDGTDTVETGYVLNGSAKAWVNLNGEGTIATRASLNVSSLTDLGVGRYKTTVSSSMSSTDYMVLATAGNEATDYASESDTQDHLAFLGARTASTQTVFSADHDDGAQDDCQAMHLAAFGDLA